MYTCPAKIASSVIFAALAASCQRPAFADTTSVNAAQAPIVRVSVRRGDVTIRTWDRAVVQVDGDASLSIERRATREPGGPRSILIPEAQTKRAAELIALPAESFVSAALPAGKRDLIVVRTTSSEPVGTVTVTIPADSVFVFAHTAKGNLELHDYRAGTFVGFANHGRLTLSNDGGTIFAQTGFGPLIANDSNIERLRARSLVGNATFTHCNVEQIEVTSVSGSIVYDNGTFEAGLARFESVYGNVAVGSASGVQLGGHTMAGHVYTNFSDATPVEARAGQADAVLKGGGPVVTATSEMGNVYLYDGSLRARGGLPPEWNAPVKTLRRPAAGDDIRKMSDTRD